MLSKKLLTVFLLLVFVFTNIALLSVSARYRSSYTMVDSVVLGAISPAQAGVTACIRSFESVWSQYFDLIGLREERDSLRRQLADALRKNRQCEELELACRRLQSLLDYKAIQPEPFLAARVVGLDPTGWFKTAVINRGSRDRVAEGMTVIVPEGIVGRVIVTSTGYSKVLLMVDGSSAIDGLVQRTRDRGIVEGTTNERCRFKYAVRKADVRIGDNIVSSGLDGVYPKGLRIGTVSSVVKNGSGLFQEIEVRPSADLSRLEEVLVMLTRRESPEEFLRALDEQSAAAANKHK